jgi:hypothetical protein
MSSRFSQLARSSATHLAVAFLAMGSWAVFANRAHPMPAPVLAGFVQGTISATITLCLKRSVEFLASRFQGIAALAAPPVIAAIISASLLTVIHTLAGTPEVAHTIAIPLTVSTIYAALYSLALWRAARARTMTRERQDHA